MGLVLRSERRLQPKASSCAGFAAYMLTALVRCETSGVDLKRDRHREASLNIHFMAVGGIGLSLFAGLAQAGDWREVARVDGAAVAFDRLSLRRQGSQLTLDMTVALMPERLLPLYGISQLVIQCDTKSASIGGMQFFLSNGDPFGERTADLDVGSFNSEPFTNTDRAGELCDGTLPPGPGADSALAFFKSVQVVED